MIATTSVAAIFALSGLGIVLIAVLVYVMIFFVVMYGITWGLIYFVKRIRDFLTPNYYD